jgi:tetratricopeptide (TPR) repeat protein
MGDLAAAEAMHRDVLAARRRVMGDDNPAVAVSLDGLGVTLVARKRYGEAAAAYGEALRIIEATYGENSAQAANTLRNVGIAFALDDRAAEGLAYMDRALQIDESNGWINAGAAYRRLQHAFISYAATRSGDAIDEARAGLAAVDSLVTEPAHGYRASGRVILATMLIDRGQRAEAASLLRTALDIHAAGDAPDPNGVALARCLFAVAQGTAPDRSDLDAVEAWGQAYPLHRALIRGAAPR